MVQILLCQTIMGPPTWPQSIRWETLSCARTQSIRSEYRFSEFPDIDHGCKLKHLSTRRILYILF